MIGQVIAGRYSIVEEVGQGGMAVIYSAVDQQTNRMIALKILRDQYVRDEEFVLRFKREGNAMMKIHHKNVVQVFEVGNDGNVYYIAMEIVRGRTLKQVIEEAGMMNPREAVNIMIALCSGLQKAHDNGIIHRDVKPDNVLISNTGEIKMSDFGIAKVVGSAAPTLTSENVLGSVHYIAPEQARGEDIDERTDVYALGISLYEMVTGRVPYEGESAVSVAIKHIQESLEPPQNINPEVSYSLSACILKACAKDPALRYQSPDAFAHDLKRALRSPNGRFADMTDDSRQIEETVKKTSRTPRQRIKGLWWLLTCLAIVFMTIFFIARAATTGDMVVVPDVSRYTLAQAEIELGNLGLQVTPENQYSDTVPEGQIISILPSAGSMVEPKSNIRIIISAGIEELNMISLTGMSVEEAKTAIEIAGFKLGTIYYVYVENMSDGLVVRHEPTAETIVPKGEEVDIYVSDSSARQDAAFINEP